jgi:hypothetical protein
VKHCRFEVHCTEHVSRLALTVGVNPGLLSNRCPRAMKSSVQPEARLVFK